MVKVAVLLFESGATAYFTIDDSIESHLIGFRAEESRLFGGTPKVIE